MSEVARGVHQERPKVLSEDRPEIRSDMDACGLEIDDFTDSRPKIWPCSVSLSAALGDISEAGVCGGGVRV